MHFDLENEPQVEADVQWVTDTQRGTSLDKNGVRIHTSEHVLSALVGLEIDKLLYTLMRWAKLWTARPFIFVNALNEAGITRSKKNVMSMFILKVIHFKDDETRGDEAVIPSDTYK